MPTTAAGNTRSTCRHCFRCVFVALCSSQLSCHRTYLSVHLSLSLIPSMYLFSSVNGPAIMTVLLDPSGPSFSRRLIRVEHTGGVVWCSSRMATTCAADTSGGRSRTAWPIGTHTILSLYLPLLSHTLTFASAHHQCCLSVCRSLFAPHHSAALLSTLGHTLNMHRPSTVSRSVSHQCLVGPGLIVCRHSLLYPFCLPLITSD